MIYSKNSRGFGGSGFYFDNDANFPEDGFAVSDSDVSIALNLPAGSSYDFTAPAEAGGVGGLIVTEPSEAFLLAAAEAAQVAVLTAAYNAAIVAPVSYTTKAGAAAVFGQSETDKSNLQSAIAGSMSSGAWAVGLWLDANGQPVSPFTFADLEGLAAAMSAADAPDFTHLLGKIAEVKAAGSVAAVQAVGW